MARTSSATPRKDPQTGTWGFIVDVGIDPKTGKRRQVRRRGYRTRNDAQAALDALRQADREGSYVPSARQTVGEWLDEWVLAIASRVRPSTHPS